MKMIRYFMCMVSENNNFYNSQGVIKKLDVSRAKKKNKCEECLILYI